MGWIDVNDKMPPSGLEVLVEASGYITQSIRADHSFFIGCFIKYDDDREPEWFLSYAYHEWKDHWVAFDNPTVHAWMPLPKHYQPQELFTQDEDLMEHAMFEDDPDWLYKGDAVYEPRQEVREKKRPKKQPEENLEGQMTITEFLQSMEA